MSVPKGKGRVWCAAAVAALVLLGLVLFGGVTAALMHRDQAGMMSWMQPMMAGMRSMTGGMGDMSGMMQAHGGDVSAMVRAMDGMMRAMDGMVAEMHPEMPAEQRAALVDECRNAMASVMGR